EMLESLGIPVIVEWSSYEPHPLGRVEWIKLYGLLTGHLDEAEAFFDESLKTLETVLNDGGDSAADTAVAVSDSSAIAQPSVANAPSVAIDSSTTSASNVAATSVDNTTSDASLSVNAADQKTVSFFYITSAGYANVRRPGDYISKMIALAGGDYLFPGSISNDESQLTAINMDLETFYTTSKDADILIYNSTVEADLTSIDDLIKKSPLLEDFKAVKTGDVWCTNKNMFQQISGTAEMIAEMHSIIHADGDIERELIYLHKLK
ncbi:MAG: ABC transporter substrate-binding protein, partial [Lachnospiraceae bacterium]|nr:ABC transporter substrate-binding protein [Lachnospiraceae bacterium]